MYKPASSISPLDHSFCVVCNTEIERKGYESWALEMGAQELPSSYDLILPCLYVYTDNNIVISGVEQCASLVCDDGAVYNDMLRASSGNIDLSPLLEN